jgi:enamine deaminase RidA (YjgF/YER057c/UK114 family)
MLNLHFTRSIFLVLSVGLLTACQPAPTDELQEFSIDRQNPPTLVDPTAFGYSQIVTVNNGRLVFIAGQGGNHGRR